MQTSVLHNVQLMIVYQFHTSCTLTLSQGVMSVLNMEKQAFVMGLFWTVRLVWGTVAVNKIIIYITCSQPSLMSVGNIQHCSDSEIVHCGMSVLVYMHWYMYMSTYRLYMYRLVFIIMYDILNVRHSNLL